MSWRPAPRPDPALRRTRRWSRRPALVASSPALATPAALALATPARMPWGDLAAAHPGAPGDLAAATRRFLDDLRVALSVAEGTGTGPGAAGDGGAGRRSGPGSGPGSAQAPEGFERVAALVELAQGGDAEAFGQLYGLYVDTVYRYVYVRVASKQTAEDLTSETFIRALRRIDSFSWQGRDIAAWFITIARNLILDNAKSARFRLEVTTADMFDADEHVDGPDTEVLDRIRDTRLLEAVRTLKPEQAECVVLRFFQGLSLAEVAEVMGKSEGAVKQLQLRAVRSLARELGDEEL